VNFLRGIDKTARREKIYMEKTVSIIHNSCQNLCAMLRAKILFRSTWLFLYAPCAKPKEEYRLGRLKYFNGESIEFLAENSLP
jgi:hypothetical protein